MSGLLGVSVNALTVIAGSFIGLLCKKGIPERFANSIMTVIGLCTIYIGFSGALKGQNTLVLILSLVSGCIVGTLINIDNYLNKLGDRLSSLVNSNNTKGNNISQGFVTASLLFCIGSMTIVGSIEAGVNGDNTMIFTKSVLDLVSSVILSASLGIGVLFSAGFVILFQGTLVLASASLGQLMSGNMISEIICAGSIMIIALGFNLIKVTNIKVANLLPSLIFVPLFLYIFSFIKI